MSATASNAAGDAIILPLAFQTFQMSEAERRATVMFLDTMRKLEGVTIVAPHRTARGYYRIELAFSEGIDSVYGLLKQITEAVYDIKRQTGILIHNS